jgi:hypothetical protein
MAERRAAATSPRIMHLAMNPPTPFAVIKVCDRGILPRYPYPLPLPMGAQIYFPGHTTSRLQRLPNAPTNPMLKPLKLWDPTRPDTKPPPNGVGGHPNPTSRRIRASRTTITQRHASPSQAGGAVRSTPNKALTKLWLMIGTNALRQLSHPIINAVAKPSHTMSTLYRDGHCSHDRWCSTLFARQEHNHTAV